MALVDDVGRLAQIPFFGIMEPDALRLLAFACETRIVLADGVLFRRGEMGDGGYLVLSGTFEVTDAQDRRTTCGRGALLAESALLREAAHDESASAIDTATIFKVPRAAVLRVLEEHPVSAQRVLAFYARRLHVALTDRESLTS